MTHVYVIQAEGGPVKVGVAADPVKRLAALRTGTPFRLSLAHVEPIDGDLRAIAVERAAHALLRAARAHNEWFAVTADEAKDAIRSAIADLGRKAELPPAGASAVLHDAQLRSARAILKLGVREIAELTGVSHFTIVRMEAGEPVKASTAAKVRSALEAIGIEFIAENGGGPGVRDNRKVR